MMTRMNGWHGIGVVASALWTESVAIYALKAISDGPFAPIVDAQAVVAAQPKRTSHPQSPLSCFRFGGHCHINRDWCAGRMQAKMAE
jgi:hypothetical protein